MSSSHPGSHPYNTLFSPQDLKTDLGYNFDSFLLTNRSNPFPLKRYLKCIPPFYTHSFLRECTLISPVWGATCPPCSVSTLHRNWGLVILGLYRAERGFFFLMRIPDAVILWLQPLVTLCSTLNKARLSSPLLSVQVTCTVIM